MNNLNLEQKKIIEQLSTFEHYIKKLNVLFKEKLVELEKHREEKASIQVMTPLNSLTNQPHLIEQVNQDHPSLEI